MSSRHEGVSCDACQKAYFGGRRYKCLICYDYDLCSACYENGSTTKEHTTDHPMQCILTRHDFDIFHGGEALASDQPQSLTCPFCGKMGFTESTLQEHVTVSHADTTFEVVCPICATVNGGDPNHVTDDFAAHLTLDHRSGAPRDLDVSESVSRHGVRRMPHQGRGLSRGVARQNMRSVNSGLFSSSSRDSMDPIAELLSQLSGVRRATASELSPTATTHLEQAATRQQQIANRRGVSGNANNLPSNSNNGVGSTQINVSNIPDSNNVSSGIGSGSSSNQTGVVVGFGSNSSSNIGTSSHQATLPHSNKNQGQQSQFLLARLSDMENEQQDPAETRERASFVQELLLSTLSELSLGGNQESDALNNYISSVASLRNGSATQLAEKSFRISFKKGIKFEYSYEIPCRMKLV